MLLQGQVGPQVAGDGAMPSARSGRTGELVFSEVHGRFYEQNSRAAIFSAGMTVTSISNSTFTTLTNSTTPILGVWNPANSTVNLVILKAAITIALTALQNTGGGPFVWASSVGNAALTLGIAPWNRKTLARTGAFGQNVSGIALTGLTNNLVIMHGAGIGGGNLYNIASLGTAAGFQTTQLPSVEYLDGSLIVPPGGVLALLATTTPIAQSAASEIMWEEVAV